MPLRAVRCRTGWGFVDPHSGEVAIAPAYALCDGFSEGRARVVAGGAAPAPGQPPIGGRQGFVDERGELVCEPRWDGAGAFSDGLAVVNVGAEVRASPRDQDEWYASGGRWGAIGPGGEVVVPVRFDRLGPFSGGLAPASRGRLRDVFRDVPPSGLAGYVDRGGSWALAPAWHSAGTFADGLAAASEGGARGAERCGWIDRRGEWLCEPRYRSSDPFAGEHARAIVGEPRGRIAGTHWVDRSGAVALAVGADVSYTGPFRDGRAHAVAHPWSEPMQWSRLPPHGYLALDGEWAIEPRLAAGRDFSEGLAAASADGRAWGYLDRDGAWAIEPRFASAGPFADGFARVTLDERVDTLEGGRVPAMALVDRAGAVVWRE